MSVFELDAENFIAVRLIVKFIRSGGVFQLSQDTRFRVRR